MRNLTATVCLTIAVLLGSIGVSWSGEGVVGTRITDGRFVTIKSQMKHISEYLGG